MIDGKWYGSILIWNLRKMTWTRGGHVEGWGHSRSRDRGRGRGIQHVKVELVEWANHWTRDRAPHRESSPSSASFSNKRDSRQDSSVLAIPTLMFANMLRRA